LATGLIDHRHDAVEGDARLLAKGGALLHRRAAGAHRGYHLRYLPLDGADAGGDLLGLVRGPLGQLADLGGDDGEALAVLAGPRRLDGGVEREQVGLGGDVVDGLDYRPHLGTALPERLHLLRAAQDRNADLVDALQGLDHGPAAFAGG